MASAPERLRLKDRIVASVAKSVKSIQEYQVACGCGEDPVFLTNTDRPCQRLTENFDHVFLHGLRHINYGYWKVVKEFTRKDAVKEISRLRNITTDLGRGRAWLMMTLNECVLESYIRCYLDNKKLVKKHYVREAFVLDEQRMNVLLTLTSGLEYAIFQLDFDVPYLDLGTYPPGSRSRTSSANSATQDDDHVSLCSMDSVTSSRGRNMSFTTAVEYTGKSFNEIDSHSQNSEETSHSKAGSVDSGILVSDKDNHVDTKRSSFPRGHDRELSLEEQEEELKVIRVSAGRKKKKSSKKGHKVHKEEVVSEDVSIRIGSDNSQYQNSWSSREPSLSDILDFDDRDYRNLPDRSPGDGMESSQESFDTNLLHRGNDKTKVMENYNIAFVDMSKEDSDYNIYKYTPIQNSQSDYFNVYKDSQNTHGEPTHTESIQQQALDLAGSSKSVDNKTEVLSTVNDSIVKSDVVEEKTETSVDMSEDAGEKSIPQTKGTSQVFEEKNIIEDVSVPIKDDSVVDSHQDFEKNSEILTAGAETSCSHDNSDNVGKSAMISSSAIQKSATSEMQDRVNDMINQTNPHLHRHMFEEEPEDIDIENGNVLQDEDKTLAGEVRLNNNTKLYLMLDVFDDSDEEFIKAFASRTGHTEGEAKTVFLLVTNRALHLLSQDQSDHRFVKDSSIPYQQLDYISLSLSNQMIQIVCLNRRKQYWITTGSQLVTRSIVDCLSQAIDRGDFDVPKISVLTDATTQKIALKKYTAQECRCEVSAVEICCYSLVHWDDPTSKGNNSDSTYREGHLLYKINEVGASLGSTLLSTVQDPSALIYGTSWKPAYVVLKDGMLCVYASKAGSKPLHFVQLGGDDCIGCRRASNTDRDHCIQVIMADGTTWQLALATDIEANEWLQSLCRAVAQGLENTSKTVSCLPCCLVLTPQKLLMCHEDVQTSFFRTLGSANLLDITNVLTDPSVNSYCILEFESHDQGVSADQWVLYFNDGPETERFLQALSSAWSTHYQVGVPDMSITDVALQKSCRDMVSGLRSSLEVKQ